MKCSIRNSCLLIAFLYRTHKHQLGDFFNSHCYFQLRIKIQVSRLIAAVLRQAFNSDSGLRNFKRDR
jgi:hypothetical protein